MKTPLVDGIIKYAFTLPTQTSGRRALEPWGGTTADTGFDSFTNPFVGSAAYLVPGMGRMAGPAAGLIEGTYGMTLGKKKAMNAGARYGSELGRTNPFLAARL